MLRFRCVFPKSIASPRTFQRVSRPLARNTVHITCKIPRTFCTLVPPENGVNTVERDRLVHANMELTELVNLNKEQLAEAKFLQMKKEGTVDVVSYGNMVKLYARLNKDRSHFNKLLDEMKSKGIETNHQIFQFVIPTLGRQGYIQPMMSQLKTLVNQGKYPDEKLYVTVIDILWKNRYCSELWDLFYLMKSHLDLQLPVFSTLLHAFARQADVTSTERLFELMTAEYGKSTPLMHNALIHAYVRVGNIPNMLKQVDKMRKEGYTPDMHAWNSMMDAYGRAKDFNAMLKHYSDMIDCGMKPDKITYNILIRAYGDHDLEEMMNWFEVMQKSGVEPDVGTFNSIVMALAQQNHADAIVDVFRLMYQCRGSLSTEPEPYVPLLRALFRSSNWNSELVLQQLDFLKDSLNLKMTSMCINMMMTAFMKDSPSPEPHVEGIVALFEDMDKKYQISPDAFTYNILLTALSKVNDVERFVKVLEKMEKDHVIPDAVTSRVVVKYLSQHPQYWAVANHFSVMAKEVQDRIPKRRRY